MDWSFHFRTGKGRVSELPDLVRGMGRNVLLAYGGGSIKKIGLYDRVKALLNGFNIVELSGIEPNPKIGSVREGVRLCRENKVDFILAVGCGIWWRPSASCWRCCWCRCC